MRTAMFLAILGGCFAGTLPVGPSVPPTKFEIKSLPGWADDQGKALPLPSRMFTGFLDGGTPPSGVGTMYFHYWLVESENNPATDPVLIWYNGGPGASSVFGLLQEWGPLRLDENSYHTEAYNRTKIPTPLANDFSWTKTHTILAIDSPPPMGLSFCSEAGPSGSPTSCGAWTDKTVFKANHQAHRSFFEKVFPELKPNPFYFIGESYAGIYVPGFANELMNDPIPGLNFQGWAVGDGWTGCKPKPGFPVNWCIDLDNVGVFKYPNTEPGPYYDVEFFHGHNQFSNELYRSIIKGCPEDELRDATKMSPVCSALIDEMSEEVGGFDPYNLFNSCPTGKSADLARHNVTRFDKHGINQALRARRATVEQMSRSFKDNDSGLSSPCKSDAMNHWLLLPETLAAIGAPADTNFINLDNGHGFNYTGDQPFVGPIYEAAISKGLRVMVYEGDNDACGLATSNVQDVFVPLFTEMNLNKTQKWRPWTLDGQQSMGGYVIEWAHGSSAGSARFVSVRGSGHLMPLNRPRVSYAMLEAFTQEVTLPPYTAAKPPLQ